VFAEPSSSAPCSPPCWLWYDCDWYGVRKNMLSRASSVWNNGWSGGYDKVSFYWGSNWSGAWACLGVGDYWADLPLGRERVTRCGNP
jgi:hypothetical protein